MKHTFTHNPQFVHLDSSISIRSLIALSPAAVQAFLNAKSASGLSPRTVTIAVLMSGRGRRPVLRFI